MKPKFHSAAALFIALAPLACLALVWNTLPQQVPMHYGMDLKPDRFGNKAEMWLSAVILAVVSIAVYFLLKNVHRFDPKRKGNDASAAFNRLALVIVVFLALLNGLFIAMAAGKTNAGTLLLPLVGCLFAVLGNYMVHIKPNYVAGFRLPWTLSNDDNWRRTHSLGGRLWFGGGLLIAVACFFLPPATGFIFFLSVTALLVVIPLVYSFRLYKQEH